MSRRESGIDRTILLWAKVNPSYTEQYHPLLWHLLDAAAVSTVMWDEVTCESAKKTVSTAMGIDIQNAGKAIAFMTALHDIGKATPFFQSLSKDRMNALIKVGYSASGSDPEPPFRHSLATAVILRQMLMRDKILGDLSPTTTKLAIYTAAAHHGLFPRTDKIIQFNSRWLGDRAWDFSRKVMAEVLVEAVGESLRKCTVDSHSRGMVQVYVAGCIAVSDWIASCEDFFPYRPDALNPIDYYSQSLAKAHDAFMRLKWAKLVVGNLFLGFRDAFPAITEPRPLQLESEKMSRQIDGPCLIIIEAPMGEGKTEAALFIQKMLVARVGAAGSYIAMPTMATANQMFHRVREFLLENGEQGTALNLHLMHGQAVLSDEYRQLREGSTIGDEPEYQVVAEEWFTYKKRGLLSPYAVGTIDQVLLGVLPTKHFFVRLAGLAGKTVVFDEVHAYDTYTSDLLIDSIRWLHSLGASIILLSATLPEKKRKELIEAWNGASMATDVSKYPRITAVTGGVQTTRSYESAKGTDAMRAGAVSIEWTDTSLDSISGLFVERLSSGGSAAVVCNTVSKA